MCGIHFLCVNRRLNIRANRETGIFRLVVYDLDGVQVVHGAQRLKDLKAYQFTICAYICDFFKSCSSFFGFKV